MSVLGVVITGLVGGLALVDVGLVIGEFATEGSAIRPNINNRRQVMEDLLAEAEQLDEEFESKLTAYINLRARVSSSYETNKLIFDRFSAQFQTIADEHEFIRQSGVFDDILSDSPPPFAVAPTAYSMIDYLMGANSLVFSTPFAVSAVRELAHGRNFLTNIRTANQNLRNVKIALERGFPIRDVNRVMNSRFSVKLPLSMARLRVFNAYFLTPGAAALSAFGIAFQVTSAIQREEEINANIKAIENYINIIKGDMEPINDSHLDGIDTENSDVPLSIAELDRLGLVMNELGNLDLEAFRSLVDFVDVYFRQAPGAEFLIVLPSQVEQAEAFYSGLLLEFFSPGLTHPDSGCRDQIADAAAYTVTDMLCIQPQISTFIQQEGIAFIVLMAASLDLNNLLDATVDAVSNVCASNPPSGADATELYCRIAMPLESAFEEISDASSLIELELRDGGVRNADGTIATAYGGVCGGVSMFDESGQFVFANGSSSACPSIPAYEGVNSVCTNMMFEPLVTMGIWNQDNLLCFMKDEIRDEGFVGDDAALLNAVEFELRSGGQRSATDFFQIETPWNGACFELSFFDQNGAFIFDSLPDLCN
ncbi:MAG: hypothetical protein AAFN74_08260 [Myxococcota bacterium]